MWWVYGFHTSYPEPLLRALSRQDWRPAVRAHRSWIEEAGPPASARLTQISGGVARAFLFIRALFRLIALPAALLGSALLPFLIKAR
jgi:hypothetical protein